MTNGPEARVVGGCGSLRDASRTRIAVSEALAAARAAGGRAELVDLREYELPALNAAEGVRDAERLRAKIENADGVLLATPNYHGAYSGALKNALDYCGRDEFENTTVGLLEVAAGDFPGTALVHLRTVCRTLRAWTLPTEVSVPDSHSTVADDGFADDAIAERTRRLGRELVEYAGVAEYASGTGRSEGLVDAGGDG
jgi:NAD(P)H-dependent FMN reductase